VTCAWSDIAVPSLGMNEPKVSTKAAPRSGSLIAEALFPRVRHQLLVILFGAPERSFYLNELVRLVGAGVGGVQRELESFERAGLVRVSRRGNQRHYEANPDCIVYAELRGLARKTRGEVERLALALAPLTTKLDEAFVYGSVARGDDHAGSDLDLLLVSDELTLEEVLEVVMPLEAELGRRVSPTLYTKAERDRRRATGNAFFEKVSTGPRIDLLSPPRGPAAPSKRERRGPA
jgi:predicted nucleotidyltransferase